MEEIKTKKCPICGMTKTVSLFGKDKSRGDGLTLYCKECLNRKYKANKEIREKAVSNYDIPKHLATEAQNIDNVPSNILIAVLRARGYEGKLYAPRKEITL